MNGEMWANPAVQRNVERLRADGHLILGPVAGAMATVGEAEGTGRMLEPEELVASLASLFAPRDLAGRHILVSAGPTREYLDPVRFLSNPSSGRMGYAVAAAARTRGARVTLVTGPTDLPDPPAVELVPVTSAEEMLVALRAAFDACDALVMTAAVADWRAERPLSRKEPKTGSSQRLELVRTADILESLAGQRTDQVMVGFAMETDAGVERAADKARRKGLDFICLNYPTRDGSGFGGDQNEVTIVAPDGSAERLPLMPKTDLAHLILDRVAAILERSPVTG
jgi:phosphopantothenoylcysteine decarboxylase/phosphopantothenate--cysteine ligase